MEKKFFIEGMSCANCALSIEKNLSNKKGIISVNVSLMGKSMVVSFDENIISPKEICSVVKKIGYLAFEENKGQNFDGTKLMKKRFIFSIIFLIPLMYFAMGEMFNFPVPNYLINLPLQFILSIVIIAINFKFYINGVKAVINGSPNMDTLVSLGSFSALVYSVVWAIIVFVTKNPTHLFFESSAMVLTLVTLGKWLEEISKKKTGEEVEKLSSMLPDTVSIMINGEEKIVNVNEVKTGDIIVYRVGDFASFDGKVIKGIGSVDKSAITGESIPVEVSVDSQIISGSVLKSGYILYQVTVPKSASVFSRIIEIVKNAEISKAPMQKLADKIAGIFVPVVTSIAIIVFLLWLLIVGDTYLAFKYSISVLVVSCPCALGLATPVVIMATTGKSASCGVLFKDADAIEKLSKVDTVFLDKTATLTEGKPKVVDFINYSNLTDERVKQIAYSLENKSNHPLADCIKDFCTNSNLEVTDFEYVIGKGIKGVVDNKTYYLGNFINVENSEKFIGKTLVIMSDINNDVIAIFAIFDQLKTDSRDTILQLKNLGVKTYMITGDN